MKELLAKLGYLWAALTERETRMPAPQPAPPEPPPAAGAIAESPPVVSPLPVTSLVESRPQPRYVRTLVVGVDFGTSSTKVVWQDLSENYFELFRWHPDMKGLQSVLLPSTVSFRADSIAFGEPASEIDDVWLPSIKLCILCSRNPAVCRCDGSAASPGCVRIPGITGSVPPVAIGCLFLANVFNLVETRLKETFPNDDVVFIWNIGCPMDHLDAADSKAAWERMAGVAMELRGMVTACSAMSLLPEAGRRMNSFAPSQDRNYFIQPEGMAAVKAFLESPAGSEQKTYAIVDVGAGTTEVSFFFNGSVGSKGGVQPSYLADSTAAVGGGKFDIELAAVWRCDVETARQRKERGNETVPEVPSIAAIREQYDRTCRAILRERKLAAKENKRFDLFVIGGGGRLPALRDALTAYQLPGEFSREHTRRLAPPVSLRNRADVEAHYDLLANACGLASSPIDWEYYPPREVAPMAARVEGTKRDREELYAK